MRILLINIPHPAIGSRIPGEQLPPLGLLCVGGPLINDGHEVVPAAELRAGETGGRNRCGAERVFPLRRTSASKGELKWV
jgi:hypothetical protein